MTISEGQNGRRAAPPDGDRDYHILVPVKTLADAKRRLEVTLGQLRAGLALAMLNDVLGAIGDSSRVAGILVVTADTEVTGLAIEHGARVLREADSQGINRAVAAGFAALRQCGAGRIAIVPSDVPLLTGPDLDRVLGLMDTQQAAAPRGMIGLCASRDGRGTNLMCLDRVSAFDFRYGTNSFHLHRKTALAAGYRPVTLTSPLISLDIDTAGDIDRYVAICSRQPAYRTSHTWQFLQANGFAAAGDRTG
jgi:2-phospho-L-lactate guanylyltransferase